MSLENLSYEYNYRLTIKFKENIPQGIKSEYYQALRAKLENLSVEIGGENKLHKERTGFFLKSKYIHVHTDFKGSTLGIGVAIERDSNEDISKVNEWFVSSLPGCIDMFDGYERKSMRNNIHLETAVRTDLLNELLCKDRIDQIKKTNDLDIKPLGLALTFKMDKKSILFMFTNKEREDNDAQIIYSEKLKDINNNLFVSKLEEGRKYFQKIISSIGVDGSE